jgi:hypothetical protein
MDNMITIDVEVEALLTDGGRGEHKWSERGVERNPNEVSPEVSRTRTGPSEPEDDLVSGEAQWQRRVAAESKALLARSNPPDLDGRCANAEGRRQRLECLFLAALRGVLYTETAQVSEVLVENGLEVTLPVCATNGLGVTPPFRASKQEVELWRVEVTPQAFYGGRCESVDAGGGE